MKYLANTFSPAMVASGVFSGHAVSLEFASRMAADAKSVVSHEITAKIMSALLGIPVAFQRVNLAIVPGDVVICVIPKFRAEIAREFTHEEVSEAGFAAYFIEVI